MIFKKHLSILLTIFLLVSNLGLAFNVHYCGTKIESISINDAPATIKVIDECCGIVETNAKCCNDKIIKAEIKSDQIIVKSFAVGADFTLTFQDWKPIAFTPNYTFKPRENTTYHRDAHAPPLYLLYSQYTFYC